LSSVVLIDGAVIVLPSKVHAGRASSTGVTVSTFATSVRPPEARNGEYGQVPVPLPVQHASGAPNPVQELESAGWPAPRNPQLNWERSLSPGCTIL